MWPFKKEVVMTEKTTRRVEAVHRIKDHPYYLDPGDIKTVPVSFGDKWVMFGWAKDSATGEVGSSSGNVSLKIQPLRVDMKSGVK